MKLQLSRKWMLLTLMLSNCCHLFFRSGFAFHLHTFCNAAMVNMEDPTESPIAEIGQAGESSEACHDGHAEQAELQRSLEQNACEPDPDTTHPNNAIEINDKKTIASDDKASQGLSTVSAPGKFSFASKFAGNEKIKMPGPGSYMNKTDFSSRHRTVPSFGFGTNTRQTRHVNKTPGPGSYDAKQGNQGSNTIGAEAKISCTPRRGSTRTRQKSPGPGAYNIPATFGRRKLTITPRTDRTLPSISVPGPGDYEVTVSHAETIMKFRAPKFSFGTARQRARLPAEFEGVTPGPGAYRNYSELPHDPSLVRSRRLEKASNQSQVTQTTQTKA